MMAWLVIAVRLATSWLERDHGYARMGRGVEQCQPVKVIYSYRSTSVCSNKIFLLRAGVS